MYNIFETNIKLFMPSFGDLLIACGNRTTAQQKQRVVLKGWLVCATMTFLILPNYAFITKSAKAEAVVQNQPTNQTAHTDACKQPTDGFRLAVNSVRSLNQRCQHNELSAQTSTENRNSTARLIRSRGNIVALARPNSITKPGGGGGIIIRATIRNKGVGMHKTELQLRFSYTSKQMATLYQIQLSNCHGFKGCGEAKNL